MKSIWVLQEDKGDKCEDTKLFSTKDKGCIKILERMKDTNTVANEKDLKDLYDCIELYKINLGEHDTGSDLEIYGIEVKPRANRNLCWCLYEREVDADGR